MPTTLRAERDPRLVVHRDVVRERRHLTVEQIDADLVAVTGSVTQPQRRAHAEAEEKGSDEVGDRNPDLHRTTTDLPGDAHQPTQRLRQDVHARLVGAGPGFPESGDRAVDQAVVESTHGVVVDAHPLDGVRPERDDEDVGVADQTGEHLVALLALQVQCNGSLAAIDAEEVGALTLTESAVDIPEAVAFEGFDLDDIGAEVAEK